MDIEKLEKLNELKEKGILTEEEFNIQKKELLSNNEQSQNVSKKQNEQSQNVSKEQDLSLWDYFVECMTKKYSCFDGRARRKEFFAFILYSNLITFVIGFMLIFIGATLDINPDIIEMIATFVNIAFAIPSISVLVRRMHDVNMSLWWGFTLIVPLIVIFFKSDMNKNKYGEVPAGILK